MHDVVLIGERWQQAVAASVAPGLAYGDAFAWRRLGGQGGVAHWAGSRAGARVFVKCTPAADAAILAAEAEALDALARTGAVRVPRVLTGGVEDETAFLALEWLDLVEGGRGATLGRALAALHRTTGPRFGWHRDNTIGASPQCNGWHEDWASFFRERRLLPQLETALRNGRLARGERDAERLLAAVPDLLEGHRPLPSLLHGDLWSGNVGCVADGTPVIFDPSSYYGDRETDVAMTRLFGGFEPGFERAYVTAFPLTRGFERRAALYNLYHVLNHLNLFGGSYRARFEEMVRMLLGAPRRH